ncbi:DinB superfamily protein [Tenacibaculum sp. MAR_2009_124]|uniref:DinB family protein n=1 Tax=Tenacibaculum sp. MAR_2009_124 TaxID=1250059 RepID=UPI00089D57D7|nr:DinB family protein [Tenacibaculum sp. MAR_2009_124]SEC43184.1 DinB superfamily protein [Tenacibaculum sp. MAR_2009_124]
MKETVAKLENLIKVGFDYISKSSEQELSKKLNDKTWSKKENIGHLIDSGINNLQRFTEIQFEDKPYKIRKYNQDALVKANDYQNSDHNEFVQLWVSLNNRIKTLMIQQSETNLNFEIELDQGKISDLRFLMNDYVDHLEHHLKQIME